MSLVAILVFGSALGGPPAVAAPTPAAALTEVADDRTPMRCKPAPYYVAERGERTVVERIMVTGSRVPLTARDFPDRRARPCFLMRYETPNPLRPAD
jgi:hypothetical protein